MDRTRRARGRHGADVVAVTGPAAGVELDRTTYVLTFDDGTPLAGVVVQVRRPTAGGHIDLTVARAAGSLPDPQAAAAGDAAAADGLYRMFRAFAGALLSWNITDGGEPVPATLEGLLGLELDHATQLVWTWLDQVKEYEQRRDETERALRLPVDALG